MKQENILQVIQGPLVTEKSSSATARKQLVFKVARKATKEQIKEAVEHLLKVNVVAVNTVNIKGKTKRFGQRVGKRKDFKKAYISLERSVDMEALLSEQA